MNKHLDKLLQRCPSLKQCEQQIIDVFNCWCELYQNDGILYLAGNGGSAADAEHIVGELMKGFILPRRLTENDIATISKENYEHGEALARGLQAGLRSFALTSHLSLTTAFANDEEPLNVFAQQLYVMARRNDVFLGISTSGNSENILRAVTIAKAKKIPTIALTGNSGGRLAKVCDYTITVPSDVTHEIQEYHIMVYHTLCIMIEDYFYGKK
ncbi:SIS domain-containing protein [Lentisphaerota bacterium WC36G]|nr:SIS domain-containing protein [Lentisphaerae bacterium WC36]